MQIQNLLIFFGGPLQCGSSILKALFLRLHNTVQDIWHWLPDDYSLADPIEPVLDCLKFCPQWKVISKPAPLTFYKELRVAHTSTKDTHWMSLDIAICQVPGKVYFYQKQRLHQNFMARLTFLQNGRLKKAQVEKICGTYMSPIENFLEEAKEITSLKKLLIFANEKLASF